LLDELSALDYPGEYDELPVAIVADELGLRLDQIRKLIKVGEIEATGRRAHERVSRKELGLLAELGTEEILRRARQNVKEVLGQAVAHLKRGDVDAAERSYRRLRARQSCIGNNALATEIAIKLSKGEREESEEAIKFILTDKPYDRLEIGAHLLEFIRDVSFKGHRERRNALRLVRKLINDENEGTARVGDTADSLQLSARYISMVVYEGVVEILNRSSAVDIRGEILKVINERIFSAMFAEAHSYDSVTCRAFILAAKRRVPNYWEPAELVEELREG
jgi:hypothetical protein